jgi:hypothetical protein
VMAKNKNKPIIAAEIFAERSPFRCSHANSDGDLPLTRSTPGLTVVLN